MEKIKRVTVELEYQKSTTSSAINMKRCSDKVYTLPTCYRAYVPLIAFVLTIITYQL